MQFSTVITASALAATTTAAFTNGTVVTTEVTVTGFTTYCPIATEVVVVTCHEDKCAPATFTVTEASTLTITEPCVIPSAFTTEQWTVTETRTCSECNAAPTGNATVSVSSFEAAGARNVAGALAGVAAVAVALF